MKILLMSSGGGGGNILRSLKALFDRDVAVTRQADPDYAERLQLAVTTRFVDTNEFSLSDLPPEERLLIGARTTGRLGARHDPDVARQALEESKAEVEALVREHTVLIVIATGGKGTGAGTIFPLAQMARRHKKLVIPVFVRPSFERHEVDKRRYDHALKVVAQFDAAKIRLIEILNDCGYADSDPQPQPIVWERMNVPIARGLRGLIYVLWDLSQVDPSDLSMLFAGEGRLRIGFGEISPPDGQDPSDADIDHAVRTCWSSPYYAFGRPTGTSLVCIQGDWSNVVDAKIKGRLAGYALGDRTDNPYNPLYARAVRSTRPWGVTAVFTEHTGTHAPVEIAWNFERGVVPVVATLPPANPIPGTALTETLDPVPVPAETPLPARSFATLWDFAVAVNRSDAAALAIAGNGSDGGIAIDPAALRKLVSTVWFRSVFQRLSNGWRERLLQALHDQVPIENASVRVGRQVLPLREASYAQLNQIAAHSTNLPDALRTDIYLLIAIGRLWGEDALKRCQFIGDARAPEPIRLSSLFQGFR